MQLGYLYSRYPVLSQTFCDAEMLELERRGHTIILGSLYPPKTNLRHEYLSKLRARIHYAPESARLDDLARRAKQQGRWPAVLVQEHERSYGLEYKAALRARNALFFVDLFERNQVQHFHVHFANRAAHTAMFVKAISGIPFSMTAHGQDFMSDLGSADLLQELCAAAEFVAAETDFSRGLLQSRCPTSAEKILRVYNGIDLTRFPLLEPAMPSHRIRLLSVGRLVEFKGFDVLVDACRSLHRKQLSFECEVIGEGPLRAELQRRVQQHALQDHIRFLGEQSANAVVSALQRCDVFVLASKPDLNGTTDVFPTVIAEAMVCSRPVISTDVAGIPELVSHGKTGLLVQPNEPEALACAIEQLAGEPELASALGWAGRQRIEDRFTIEKTIAPLVEQFTRVFGSPSAPSGVGSA